MGLGHFLLLLSLLQQSRKSISFTRNHLNHTLPASGNVISRSLSSSEEFANIKVQDVTSKEYHLRKTVFNDHVRLLVVAGLEGTGHHAVSAMFNICSRKKPPSCEVEKAVTQKTMQYFRGQKLVHGLFGAADTAKSLRIAASVKSSLEEIANRTGDRLFFLGLGGKKGSGMYSYPNFNGKFKSLDHPDIYQLGLLAEQAGVDYRVLVLQRNGMDVLKSVDRRDFGKADEEPKILVDNAAVLHGQLALLDPRFYYCLHYERLNELKTPAAKEEREDIVHFLHPKNFGGGVLEEMLTQIRPPSSKSGGRRHLVAGNGSASVEEKDPRTHSLLRSSAPAASPTTLAVRNSLEHNSTMEYLAFLLNARISLINDLCRKPKELLREDRLRNKNASNH